MITMPVQPVLEKVGDGLGKFAALALLRRAVDETRGASKGSGLWRATGGVGDVDGGVGTRGGGGRGSHGEVWCGGEVPVSLGLDGRGKGVSVGRIETRDWGAIGLTRYTDGTKHGLGGAERVVVLGTGTGGRVRAGNGRAVPRVGVGETGGGAAGGRVVRGERGKAKRGGRGRGEASTGEGEIADGTGIEAKLSVGVETGTVRLGVGRVGGEVVGLEAGRGLGGAVDGVGEAGAGGGAVRV